MALKQDPDALLGPCEIDVTIAGQEFTIAALPAAEWIEALAGAGYWGAVIPGMLSDTDQATVGDLLLEDDGDRFDPEELNRAAREALGAAAGMKWWVARSLILSVVGSWVMGEMIRQHIDPERLSLGAWLAAAYRVITMNLSDEKRQTIDAQLDARPPDVPADEWFDEAEASANFLAFAAGSADG